MPKFETSCSLVRSNDRVGGVYFFEDHDCIDRLGLNIELDFYQPTESDKTMILSLSGSHSPTRGLQKSIIWFHRENWETNLQAKKTKTKTKNNEIGMDGARYQVD